MELPPVITMRLVADLCGFRGHGATARARKLLERFHVPLRQGREGAHYLVLLQDLTTSAPELAEQLQSRAAG